MTENNIREKNYRQIREKGFPHVFDKTVYTIDKEPIYHYERVDMGHDDIGWLGYRDIKVIDGYRSVITGRIFSFALLDEYALDAIYTTKEEAEAAKEFKGKA